MCAGFRPAGNPHGVSVCAAAVCRRLPRSVQVLAVSSRAGVVQQDDLPGMHGALWLPHTGNPHGSGCLVLLRLRPAGQGLHNKMIHGTVLSCGLLRCIGVCWVPSRRHPARFRLPRAVQVSSVSSRAGVA